LKSCKDGKAITKQNMRTIAEIKESMMTDFMHNNDLAKAYGFEVGTDFYGTFSRVSVESLLLYIVAVAVWVLESIVADYKSEVEHLIEAETPHRAKWYRDRTLRFMHGHELQQDTDRYDTEGMTESEIAQARVVKYAAASESPDSSILIVKVAGEKDGRRSPLDTETEHEVAAYLAEIKDAGVRISLVNRKPDRFDCELDIYYNPVLLPSSVEENCRETIGNYIRNLPFNGEYTNMALTDALQVVEGVKIVELKTAYAQAEGNGKRDLINARYVPAAGYFEERSITINMKAY